MAQIDEFHIMPPEFVPVIHGRVCPHADIQEEPYGARGQNDFPKRCGFRFETAPSPKDRVGFGCIVVGGWYIGYPAHKAYGVAVAFEMRVERRFEGSAANLDEFIRVEGGDIAKSRDQRFRLMRQKCHPRAFVKDIAAYTVGEDRISLIPQLLYQFSRSIRALVVADEECVNMGSVVANERLDNICFVLDY